MLLDEIEQKYPERIVSSLLLKGLGFKILFDLPEEKNFVYELSIFVKKESQEKLLRVFEFYHDPLPNTNDCEIHGEKKDIPRLLREYLKKAVGDFETNLYNNDFIAEMIVHFFK